MDWTAALAGRHRQPRKRRVPLHSGLEHPTLTGPGRLEHRYRVSWTLGPIETYSFDRSMPLTSRDITDVLRAYSDVEQRRATGGVLALSGFDFQTRVYVADLAEALATDRHTLQPAGEVFVEALSDLLKRDAEHLVCVQIKRTLTPKTFRGAAAEVAAISRFLSTAFPEARENDTVSGRRQRRRRNARMASAIHPGPAIVRPDGAWERRGPSSRTHRTRSMVARPRHIDPNRGGSLYLSPLCAGTCSSARHHARGSRPGSQ